MSKLYMPEVTDFRELFPEATPHDVKSRPPAVAEWESEWNHEKLVVSSFCSVRGKGNWRSLQVKPTEAVLACLKEQLCVPGDVSFEVVVRSEKEALVLAKYSQIIGGRWLSEVDPKTILTFEG